MARLNYNKSWVDKFLTVMLGLRTTIRLDTGITAAQILYGSNIRLQGDFFDVNSNKFCDSDNYVSKLKDIIESYKPVTRSNNNSSIVHKVLNSREYVFLRNDAA